MCLPHLGHPRTPSSHCIVNTSAYCCAHAAPSVGRTPNSHLDRTSVRNSDLPCKFCPCNGQTHTRVFGHRHIEWFPFRLRRLDRVYRISSGLSRWRHNSYKLVDAMLRPRFAAFQIGKKRSANLHQISNRSETQTGHYSTTSEVFAERLPVSFSPAAIAFATCFRFQLCPEYTVSQRASRFIYFFLASHPALCFSSWQ